MKSNPELSVQTSLIHVSLARVSLFSLLFGLPSKMDREFNSDGYSISGSEEDFDELLEFELQCCLAESNMANMQVPNNAGGSKRTLMDDPGSKGNSSNTNLAGRHTRESSSVPETQMHEKYNSDHDEIQVEISNMCRLKVDFDEEMLKHPYPLQEQSKRTDHNKISNVAVGVATEKKWKCLMVFSQSKTFYANFATHYFT